MRTTTPSVVDRRMDVPARPGASPQGAMAREAPLAARRFALDHWLIDLLAFVLASLLVGATALYGLTVMPAWMAEPNPLGAGFSAHEEPIATSNGSGAWDDLLCCHEGL